MKQFSKLLAANISLVLILLSSCKKEPNISVIQEAESASEFSKQPFDPGFAENDMVMYWNDKVATVLGAGINQPSRTRYFAIIQIAARYC
jgi:hypothetical protein